MNWWGAINDVPESFWLSLRAPGFLRYAYISGFVDIVLPCSDLKTPCVNRLWNPVTVENIVEPGNSLKILTLILHCYCDLINIAGISHEIPLHSTSNEICDYYANMTLHTFLVPAICNIFSILWNNQQMRQCEVKFISLQVHSTCFGRHTGPSSGVQF